jgi:extradiol dioxygenase family protein
VRWVREPTTDYAGTSQEQTKAVILDPSGNAIELKAYVDAPAALETPAAAWRPGRSP